MPMVSLERTEEEARKKAEEWDKMPHFERASYPVSLYLSTDEVKKLGLENVDVDEEMVMVARVKVSSVSNRKEVDGTPEHNVTLDFMSAEVQRDTSSDDMAERIFGE